MLGRDDDYVGGLERAYHAHLEAEGWRPLRAARSGSAITCFFASLKKELTRRRAWPTRRELQTAVFAWIEGWYNRRRLHSTLGYLSPAAYEDKYTLTEGGRAHTPLAA